MAQTGVLVQAGALRTFSIYSRSMMPTLQRGDELLGYAVDFWGAEVERGDLVAFEPPVLPPREELVVKRVVAVAGDRVAVRRGAVIINGQTVRAPGLSEVGVEAFGPYRLPPGSLFVLGDRPAGSEDSTVFGPLGLERVRYLIAVRYSPWSERCSFDFPAPVLEPCPVPAAP